MKNNIQLYKNDSSNHFHITNIVYGWTENGIPCYVGYTTQDVNDRIDHHRYNKSSDFIFQRHFRKRPHNFICYLLAQSDSLEELKRLEAEYVKKYNTYIGDNPEHGYNMTRGGEGNIMSDEQKRKISAALTGKKKPPRSQVHCINQSISQLGNTHKRGKKLSEESKLKISLAQKGKTRTSLTVETRLKISEANRGKKRTVEQNLANSNRVKAYWERKRLGNS